MAPLEEGLPGMHKTLGLIPSTAQTKGFRVCVEDEHEIQTNVAFSLRH